jgi:anti-sigma factor RsiW
MDYEAQLKLQAFLDGELPEAEARKVAEWLARDREAAALVEELRNTREAIVDFAAALPLPESREFFWSKVQREIQRLETADRKPVPTPVFGWVRRFLVPVAAVALVIGAGMVFFAPTSRFGGAATAGVETALADAGAFTYRDYSAGTTLVWLTYPADNEVADDDEMGTIE